MERILTLDEARSALNLKDPNAERDVRLAEVLDGVGDAIEKYLGDWVVPRDEGVELQPGITTLPGSNVRAIASAETVAGEPVDVTGLAVSAAGVLTGSLPPVPWLLTVAVGLDPIPRSVANGAREVLRQAWEIQRSETPSTFLIPYRAAAWLDGHALVGGFA